MLDWIWTAVIGLIAGTIAKSVMKNFSGGMLLTMCLGIAGSMVMTWIGQAVGWYSEGEGARFIASTLGAILILWAYAKFVAKKATS